MKAVDMLCSLEPLVQILNDQLSYLLSSPSLGPVLFLSELKQKSSTVTTSNDSNA